MSAVVSLIPRLMWLITRITAKVYRNFRYTLGLLNLIDNRYDR